LLLTGTSLEEVIVVSAYHDLFTIGVDTHIAPNARS